MNKQNGKLNINHQYFPFSFTDEIVLRTPLFPFCETISEETIVQAAANTLFMEAVYLASPSLHSELQKLKQGGISNQKEKKKILVSAAKYFQRMSSRCTPFGLFATTSLVEWKDAETDISFNTASFNRYTRLDMHFLGAFMQKLNNEEVIKSRLKFFPNNSLYPLGTEYRFTEYVYENERRIYRTSSVERSEYLQQLIEACRNGLTIQQMTAVLIKDEISEAEATEFINEAIIAQVFVSELSPAVAGMDMMQQVIHILQQINTDASPVITSYLSQLKCIQQLLQKADANKINDFATYQEILDKLTITEVLFEGGKIFQTDSFRYPVHSSVNNNIRQQLIETLLFADRLNKSNVNESLTEFAKKFTERFEQQEIPLLYALDTETGIGYSNYRNIDLLPLADGIVPVRQGNATTTIQLNTIQSILFQKLLDAHQAKAREIELTGEDIPEVEHSFTEWPPSFSITFRLIKEKEHKIFFEFAGNPSANNLLGRFAHGHPGIHELINHITNEEEIHNPDVIFAEVVHLPENRLGNILLRPSFRKHEIPFVSVSSRSEKDQIPLADIVIRVRNGKVYLYSKKMRKCIIPRLSSAHNYSHNALPVYNFLCDLQTQELKTFFGFNWGSLAVYFEFLPRVTYRHTILSPATWQLKKEKIKLLLGYIQKNEKDNIAVFFKQHYIPQYIVLADGDNELLVDTNSILSLQAFCSTVKKREFIVLKEYYRPAGNIKIDETELLAGQFIVPLTKKNPSYKEEEWKLNEIFPPDAAVQRVFIPGSEWLYLKLYCGSKTADHILTHHIQPLVQSLKKQQVISNWFFIRYSDPGFHIRMRLHIRSPHKYNMVMQEMVWHFQQPIEQGLVSKMAGDTYIRELERYGNDTIDIAEQLFHIDSEMKLHFLNATGGDEREELRWVWGMKNIDWLLNCFSYTLPQKEQLLKKLKEFRMNKHLGQQINKKYSKYRSKIEAIFTGNENELLPVEMFALYEEQCKDLYRQLVAVKDAAAIDILLESYIHMLLNRLFVSESRLQEMVLYDFLYKIYVYLRRRGK
jgi:lantibiotic biosynthesis protein